MPSPWTFMKLSKSKEKKYDIILLICEIWKNGTDDLIFKAEIETQM